MTVTRGIPVEPIFNPWSGKQLNPLCTSKLPLVIVVAKEILFTTYFHEENLSSTFVYLEKLDLCKFLCTCLTLRESTRWPPVTVRSQTSSVWKHTLTSLSWHISLSTNQMILYLTMRNSRYIESEDYSSFFHIEQFPKLLFCVVFVCGIVVLMEIKFWKELPFTYRFMKK